MKVMIFTGDSQAEIREVPTPELIPGYVLVKMKAAGLCGSDLHGIYESTKQGIEARNRRMGRDIIPGHEPCGVVEAIGDGVHGLNVGDRVIVNPWVGCGVCRLCRAGWDNLCVSEKAPGSYGWGADGCFADEMLADARYCVKMPDWLSFEVGAHLACGGGTVYSALKPVKITTDDTALAVGLGPVGLGAVAIMKAWGAKVIGVDIVQERLELAKIMGADEVIDASRENAVQKIKEMTNGEGVNVAADFSGSPVGRNTCINAAGLFGRVVFVGERNDTTINPSGQLLGKRITIYSSRVFGHPELLELLRFVKRHDIHLEKIITHRFPLEQGPEVMKLFQTAKTGKIIFAWQ